MGARLSETELQNSLNFCVNLFNPTSPEQHERVAKVAGQIGEEFLDITAPVVDPKVLESVLRVEHRSRVKSCEIKLLGTRHGATLHVWTNSVSTRIAKCFNNLVSGVSGTPNGFPGRLRADSESSGDETNSDCEKAVETRMVLHKINARRVVHSEYSINNFEVESLGGFVARLEKGRLGLVTVR
jgi:flavine halogenase